MTKKSKLGRNPFNAKKTTKKSGQNAAKNTRSIETPEHCPFAMQIIKTVRWVSFDAPIGLCFLAYQFLKVKTHN